MKTLQLEHFAPYLQHEVEIHNEALEHLQTLNGIEQSNEGLYLHAFGRNNYQANTQSKYYYSSDLKIKLVLIPLSDLTKLGDENTPITEHTINLGIEEKFGLEYGIFSHYKGDLDIELDGDSYLQYDANKSISLDVAKYILNELHRGHYDTEGLIEAGLAIDKNTLNQ